MFKTKWRREPKRAAYRVARDGPLDPHQGEGFARWQAIARRAHFHRVRQALLIRCTTVDCVQASVATSPIVVKACGRPENEALFCWLRGMSPTLGRVVLP